MTVSHHFSMIFFPLSKSRKLPSTREKPGGYCAFLRLPGRGVIWLKNSSLKINKSAFKFLFTDEIFSKIFTEKCVKVIRSGP